MCVCVEGGGDSSMKCLDVCVGGSENVPIYGRLSSKNIHILKGSSAHFIPIFWCNINWAKVYHLQRLFTIPHILIIWYSLC